MNNKLQAGMAEAMRLTREGSLAEATAVIQRTLGGTSVRSRGGAADAHESPGTTSRVVNGTPQPTAARRPVRARRSLRRAPRLPRRFRGATPPPGAQIATPAGVSAAGLFVERSYSGRAGTRVYKLYIPSGYVGQEVPLVVMLHGCTQSPGNLATGTRMNLLAEEHTFLVAYPAQAAAANSSRCWKWFEAADQQRGRGEPSLIAGITREVIDDYHVAVGQVYVAGMSAGGAMGATYPDLYAAVGIHSGLAPGAASDLRTAFAAMRQGQPGAHRRSAPTEEFGGITRAILFHGDRDTTVHPSNADHVLAHYLAAARGEAPQPTKRRGVCPAGTPTRAPPTATPRGGSSWGTGPSTASDMPGRVVVSPARTPTLEDPTPRPRWCVSSTSTPGSEGRREGRSVDQGEGKEGGSISR